MGHRLIAVGVAVAVASPGGAVLDRSSEATALGSTRVGPTEVKYYGSITGEWLLTTRWNWPRWKHYPGDPCFYEREGNNAFRVVYTTNGRFVISPFKGGATIRTEGGKARFSNLVLHSGTGTMVEHAEPGKEGQCLEGDSTTFTYSCLNNALRTVRGSVEGFEDVRARRRELTVSNPMAFPPCLEGDAGGVARTYSRSVFGHRIFHLQGLYKSTETERRYGGTTVFFDTRRFTATFCRSSSYTARTCEQQHIDFRAPKKKPTKP